MEQFPPPIEPDESADAGSLDGRHAHPPEEWGEALTRSVAHLAAQLTMAQIRLRALATELQEQGTVDRTAVSSRERAIALAEGGGYLRQNLGEALVEVIDVEALEQDLIEFLDRSGPG